MQMKKQVFMIRSVRLIALLDTNVIYPIISRDLLFWFAYYDLYTPKWSNKIFDEWRVVMIRKGVSESDALNRVNKANLAFPDASVKNYENLIQNLILPDENDRHILAAAIKTNANIIVTNNLKDFPSAYLDSFGLKAKSLDDFFTDIIDLNQEKAFEAFEEMVLNKKNPPLDAFEVLDQIIKINLKDTANYLQALL